MSHAPPYPEAPPAPGTGEHAEFEPGHRPGHEHPDFLAHHFETPKQQFEAGKLGMWLFLATEVLLFGGLFCGYAVWRGNHPELFKYGSQFLDTTMGAINTAVLILSSLTMAWGVTAAQQNRQGLLRVMLMLTLCGAAGFLVIKYFEYSHKFHEGYFPGPAMYEPHPHSHSYEHGMELSRERAAAASAAAAAQTPPPSPAMPPAEAPTFAPAAMGPQGLNAAELAHGLPHESHVHSGAPQHVHPALDPQRPPNPHVFFNIYFMMTGLHGIHVAAGMVVIIWLLVRSFKGHFSGEYFTPVDLGGLYWHVVDLIWIFLFPLFYLI